MSCSEGLGNNNEHLGGEKLDKECPSCHKLFTCIVGSGCWCEKLVLTREVLKQIRRRYMDCLCNTCLKAYTPSDN
jgi:hypothetical protein